MSPSAPNTLLIPRYIVVLDKVVKGEKEKKNFQKVPSASESSRLEAEKEFYFAKLLAKAKGPIIRMKKSIFSKGVRCFLEVYIIVILLCAALSAIDTIRDI